MLHIVGANDQESVINDSTGARKIASGVSERVVKFYGTFGGAKVQIGYEGRDEVGYFDAEGYTESGAKKVTAGKGGVLMAKISDSSITTDLYVEELFV